MEKEFYPVVYSIVSKDIYYYFGNDVYQNIRTGVKGKIPEAIAKRELQFYLEASQLFNGYPLLAEMVNRLNLKVK